MHRLLSLFSLTKFSDQPYPRQLSNDSFECSSDYLIDKRRSVGDDDGLISNGRLQGKLMKGEDQVNSMHESATLPHYNIRNIISSTENPIQYSHMDNRNLNYNSACQCNAEITMPNLHSQTDCITSMPNQTSVYLENIALPSVTQSQINASCSDPNLRSMPTREFENDGSLGRSIITSKYPYHGLNYSLFSYQNDQGLGRQENTEACYMCVPESKEYPIQLPFDSVKVSSMPSIEHTAANHGQNYFGNSEDIHSDRERKGSVFSRLIYPSDASIPESDSNDRADHEKLFLDSFMDEDMSVLEGCHWQREKTNHEMLSQEHNVGRNPVKKKKAKSSLSSYINCFQVSDELATNTEDSIDGNSDHIAMEIPFVDFKRRRKPCRVEENAPTCGNNVNVGSDQLSGVQQKRRKLIRPSFVYNELHDSGDTKNVSPILEGTSKDSLIRGRANCDHIIEMDKGSKLCQAAELSDIIWLVDDGDKNIGSVTVVTAEDCCRSSRNGSEDGMASSNCTSDLNITSNDLGVNESCSSNCRCSTSDDHTASQNLNDSGICSRQELSLEGSELNAGNSFIGFNEGSENCKEKELVRSTKIGDEPYNEGYAVLTGSSGKSPLDSVSESVPEEVLEGRKQNN